MKIQPLFDRVLLEAVIEELKMGGIILPDTVEKERPQVCLVTAVGPGKFDEDGERIKMTVKKGDKVLVTKYGPSEVKLEDKDYLICREDDILGIIQ